MVTKKQLYDFIHKLEAETGDCIEEEFGIDLSDCRTRAEDEQKICDTLSLKEMAEYIDNIITDRCDDEELMDMFENEANELTKGLI